MASCGTYIVSVFQRCLVDSSLSILHEIVAGQIFNKGRTKELIAECCISTTSICRNPVFRGFKLTLKHVMVCLNESDQLSGRIKYFQLWRVSDVVWIMSMPRAAALHHGVVRFLFRLDGQLDDRCHFLLPPLQCGDESTFQQPARSSTLGSEIWRQLLPICRSAFE